MSRESTCYFIGSIEDPEYPKQTLVSLDLLCGSREEALELALFSTNRCYAIADGPLDGPVWLRLTAPLFIWAQYIERYSGMAEFSRVDEEIAARFSATWEALGMM